MSNAFMRRSYVYALAAVASAFLFQPLTFIDSIFLYIRRKVSDFSRTLLCFVMRKVKWVMIF